MKGHETDLLVSKVFQLYMFFNSFRALALPPRSFNYLSRSSIRMENLTFSSEAGAKPRGALIVVEGLDRSGKSTQCAKLRSFLESSGHPTELWRFPDRETSVGQMISAYLSNKSQLDDRTIHLLFSANRWEKRFFIFFFLSVFS